MESRSLAGRRRTTANLPVSPNALHEPSQETKLLERCFRLGEQSRESAPAGPPSTGLTGERLLSCHVMRNSEANPLSWRRFFFGTRAILWCLAQALGFRVRLRASVDTLYEPGAKLPSCQRKTPTISTAHNFWQNT